MNGRTYEGLVTKGQIRLRGNVHLPENTKVYVVIPEEGAVAPGRISTPRLARPEQAGDFRMEVIEEGTNAGV